MCGIIGAFHTGEKKEPVNEIVLDQFENQKERGVNGFGIIKIYERGGYKVDRATEGYKFMWDIHHNPVRKMLAHHRIPTSSDNKLKQTHPFLVESGSLQFNYLLVHNGVIHNDDEMKKKHEDELGFVYKTIDGIKYNDSEGVAIEVARFIEGQTTEIGTRGSVAFVCLQVNKKTDKVTKLFFGRNDGNPLKMAKTRNKLILSSTGPGVDIKPFYLYDCKLDAEMKLSKQKMPFATLAIEKPSYINQINEKRKKAVERYNNKWAKQDGFTGIVEHSYNKHTGQTPREYDFEDEDLPQTEAEEAITRTAENIQADLDGFLDMLYDAKTAETLQEKDIEVITESIRIYLGQGIKEVNNAYLEKALIEDSKQPIAY